MDSTTIARILWATTRDLDAADPATATAARQALANMLAAGFDRGFAPPLAPAAADLNSAAWKDCSAVAALATAAQAVAPPGTPVFALLAPVQAPGGTDLDHGLAWPGAAGSKRDARIGPLRRQGDPRDWYLDTYAEIDSQAALGGGGDARPGLYTRTASTAAAQPRTPPSPRAYAQSYLLFLAAVALVLASIAVTSGVSRLAERAQARVLTGGDLGCSAALAAPDTGDRIATVRNDCDTAWRQAWEAATEVPATAAVTQRLGGAALRLVQAGGGASLVAPLALSYAAVLVLILAGGLATTGTWFGALVDNRNRVSLSRLQMLAWTVVLLGAYVVIGTFNVALLGSAVRDLTLNAGSWAAAKATALQGFVGFFPNMDAALWAALGLTAVATPLVSQVILNRKAGDGGDAHGVEVRPLVATAPLETRERLDQSRWSDLITGEEAANAGQVDVSRLQFLVITFMLLGSYLVLLLRYLGSVGGTQILIAAHDHAPVFPSMPPVDGTFLGLLALSHGGYLAFKALPSAGAGGVTG